ncbi:trypsin-like peptidase domain-containing protein [Chitinophaga sp. YIM B06452]|uniref:trypsin-like peptidase domain-containing protein n=1 Tax=Chitinophaga sp. YIM B06452 TaxID=3082158 RepID=UPI0031FE8613
MRSDKVKIRAAVLIALLFIVAEAFGQQKMATDAAIRQAVKKSWSASVKAFAYDTLRRAQAGGPFSAVVVTADGYMLTVAHATRPGMIYKIFFPDGRTALAQGMGRIDLNEEQTLPDIAVMRILDAGAWPFAEMGSSGNLTKGTPCLMLAYPESTGLPLPNVRFGYITDPLDRNKFVVSDCTMEVGDSGGPVFDLEGRVIGLNSRCATGEGINYHVPVDEYKKYWTSLVKQQNYTKYPEDSSITALSHPALSPEPPLPSLQLEKSCLPVHIISQVNDQPKETAGTIWKTNRNGTWIIGKSSDLGESPVIRAAKRKDVPLKVLARNVENDLVLLFSDERLTNGNYELSRHFRADTLALGNFIYVPLPSGQQKRGVVSTAATNMPPRSTAGYLGLMLIDKNDVPTVEFLDPDGPAGMAGIRKGDVFVRLNGAQPAGAVGFSNELLKFPPLQTITIGLARGDSLIQKEVALGERPVPRATHASELFEGGKSRIRDGFKGAWLCDAHVKAIECGAPVYSADGEWCGIVIARFSRTATVILPASLVRDWLSGPDRPPF